MKPLFYLLLLCVATTYIACSKNVGADPTPPPNTPVDSNVTVLKPGLLIKTVNIGSVATDSAVTVYDYDKNGLVTMDMTTFYHNSSSPATSVQAGRRYYRDALGRIARIAAKELADPPYHADTVYSSVTYQDATGSKVSFVINSRVINSKTIYDSTVYSYDTGDNLAKITLYVSGDWPAVAATLQHYELWEYNQTADPIKYQYYQELSTPGVFELIWQYDFEYDDKVNPNYAKDDVRADFQWIMKHNITLQHVFESVSNDTHDNVLTYEYNSDNKPVKSIQTGPYPSTIMYYYSH